MSAYLVCKTHIDALVAAGLEFYSGRLDELRWFDVTDVDLRELDWKEVDAHSKRLTYDNATEVGRMLWVENLNSICARYPDVLENPDAIPGPIGTDYEEVVTYEYKVSSFAIRGGVDPLKVLSAIACYRYQACEHNGWPSSEAARFIDALEQKMIRAIPGYGDGPWEVRDLNEVAREPFVARSES